MTRGDAFAALLARLADDYQDDLDATDALPPAVRWAAVSGVRQHDPALLREGYERALRALGDADAAAEVVARAIHELEDAWVRHPHARGPSLCAAADVPILRSTRL